jgi:hypothetical protein
MIATVDDVIAVICSVILAAGFLCVFILMILMSTAGIIASPFAAFAPDGGILPAMAVLIVSAMFLWLSVRWFLWSLRD